MRDAAPAGYPAAPVPYAPEGRPGPEGALPRPGQGRGDPRLGRPTRSGTLAAYLALIVAGGAVFPVLTAVGVLVWLVLARTTDRSVTSLVLRRHERGRRGSDVPVAVVSGPWHLVVAILGTVLTVVLPVLVAVSAAFCAALAVAALKGGAADPNSLIPLAAGALFGVVMIWWGPGGASTRRGSRSLVRGLSPAPVAPALVILLLVAAAGIAGWGVLHGAPVWWPVGEPGTWTRVPMLP